MGRIVRIEVGAKEKSGKTVEDVLQVPVDSFAEIEVYSLYLPSGDVVAETLQRITSEAPLVDPIVQSAAVNSSFARAHNIAGDWVFEYHLHPGTKDSVGDTGMDTLKKVHPEIPEGARLFSSKQLILRGQRLTREDVEKIAQLVANKELYSWDIRKFDELSAVYENPSVPLYVAPFKPVVERFDLAAMTDAELFALNKDLCLATTLDKLKYVRDHFNNPVFVEERRKVGLDQRITDVELEGYFGIKSQHCNHDDFKADIYLEAPFWFMDEEIVRYVDDGVFKPVEGKKDTFLIDGLFKNFIREPTRMVRERLKGRGLDWVVKAFTDNAGTILFEQTEEGNFLLCYKVETHNSPSAKEPREGAKTGIDGNNRDIMGNGRAGFDLLFNGFFYCVGDPAYRGTLPPDTLTPYQIMTGIVAGVKEGGNQSQVPTLVGGMLIDPRYIAKPLVYCMSAGGMPEFTNGVNTFEKILEDGDLFCVVGGRVGLDGIHGGTTSSLERTESTALGHVQNDDAYLQNKEIGFQSELAHRGNIHAEQDFGAVGLMSSFLELAILAGGGELDMDKHPAKYEGLMPKHIGNSESQNRMGMVIPPEELDEDLELAKLHEVEMTPIGKFNRSGYVTLRYKGEVVGLFDIGFLEKDPPSKTLYAVWTGKKTEEAIYPRPKSYLGELEHLLSHTDIASKEWIFRKKDAGVKGQTVIPPLLGNHAIDSDVGVVKIRDIPGNAAVATSFGIEPKMSDLDPYHAATTAFTDMVGKAVATGALLPDLAKVRLDSWAACDNFCTPNFDYDLKKNPQGKENAGKVLRLAMGMRDSVLALNVPTVSGKDSVKNSMRVSIPPEFPLDSLPEEYRQYFIVEEQDDGRFLHIHAPSTLLMSTLARVPDYRLIPGQDFKRAGDLVYLVGMTRRELAGTEYYEMKGLEVRGRRFLGEDLPRVDFPCVLNQSRVVEQLIQEGLVASAAYVHKGGLGTALFKSAAINGLGVHLDLLHVSSSMNMSPEEILFSRTPGRYVLSVAPERKGEFERMVGSVPHAEIGKVGRDFFSLAYQGKREVLPMEDLLSSFKATFKCDLPARWDR